MDSKGNTILITGGTGGIGFTLAERFHKLGNKIIICGRNEENLSKAAEKLSGIKTIVCDVGNENDRIELFKTIEKEYPETNVLINNAGIQCRVDLKNVEFSAIKQEIEINLEAPIHFSTLFVPFLTGKKNAYIVNVTSGLAFMPPAWVPIYGATKAGLHSFTFSLREQLKGVGIGVFEIIPPAVKTNLGGNGVHAQGVDVNEFVDSVMADIESGANEASFGGTGAMTSTRQQLEQMGTEMYGKMTAAMAKN